MSDREIIDRYYELAEQGRREDGIEFLEEYIRNTQDNVSAKLLAHTGNHILMYTEELERGIEYFHRAIEKEPENPDIYWTYFTDLDEITDEYPETIDDAVLCLTKIIEISSKIEPVRAGDVLEGNFDTENEKKYNYIGDDFNKEESIARRYRDLAAIYMKIPDYEKAEECIDKTLKVLPNDNYSNSIKNKIMVATGRRQEAEVISDEDEDEINAVGWDAITAAFEEIYPGQHDPRHYGVIIPWSLGGKDPLDGISVYDGGDYWHFVSFGLSELYEKESENLEYSGFGIEFTFKLKKGSYDDEDAELVSICGILQQIARIIFNDGEMFYPYEYLYTGQTQGIDSQGKSNITGFITVPEPKKELIETPNGKVELLEFIGVTDSELQAVMNKELNVKELYERLGSDVTAYDRESIVL